MRVLMSPARGTDQTNPFVDMLAASLLDRGVDVARFTWSAALFSRYDVLHVHWPEALVRSRGRLGGFVKPLMLLVLLAVRRALGRRHVSTVHNLQPHESGRRLERLLIRLWSRSCSARVYLTVAGLEESGDAKGQVIPHGDYEPLVRRYQAAASRPAIPGRLLMFGQLREYKGVEALIDAFAGLGQRASTLHVVGMASSPEYAEKLNARAEGADGVLLQTDHALSNDELIAEIASAEVVVLPYRRIYNSGAAFLALTVGRPLIVTPSPSMRELQAEVGGQWVHVLPGEVDSASLGYAVESLREAARAGRPVMKGRAWPTIASQYEAVYRCVIAR